MTAVSGPPDRFSRTFTGTTEGACLAQASAYARELAGTGYRSLAQSWSPGAADRSLTVTYERGATGVPAAARWRGWHWRTASGLTALVVIVVLIIAAAASMSMTPQHPRLAFPSPSVARFLLEATGTSDHAATANLPAHSELRYRHACAALHGTFSATVRTPDGEILVSVTATPNTDGEGSKPISEGGDMTVIVEASGCTWWLGIAGTTGS